MKWCFIYTRTSGRCRHFRLKGSTVNYRATGENTLSLRPSVSITGLMHTHAKLCISSETGPRIRSRSRKWRARGRQQKDKEINLRILLFFFLKRRFYRMKGMPRCVCVCVWNPFLRCLPLRVLSWQAIYRNWDKIITGFFCSLQMAMTHAVIFKTCVIDSF